MRYQADGSLMVSDALGIPPELFQQTFQFAIPLAAGNTDSSDLSGFGLPFKRIRMTKTGSTATAAVTVGVNARGVCMINVTSINASDSLAFYPSFDGTNFSLQPLLFRSYAAGAMAPASAIAASGLYNLVVD